MMKKIGTIAKINRVEEMKNRIKTMTKEAAIKKVNKGIIEFIDDIKIGKKYNKV